jgi:hypothetical protein
MARLSDEIKAQTHAALIKHNGDRRLAAAELGMDPVALKDRIHACPELKSPLDEEARRGKQNVRPGHRPAS